MISVLKSKMAAALVASAALFPASAHAMLVNPGFETGDLTGWDTSGSVGVFGCAVSVIGCAPNGGTYNAQLNPFNEDANASLRQTTASLSPGQYAFGAYVSFGTNDAAGNFDQGQISLTAQGPGTSESVGFDPNALNGQFTIPAGSLSFTDWFLLSGVFNYTGPGDAPFLLNINVQNFTLDKNLTLVVDNAFVNAVPVPAALPLFAGGLGGLGLLGWWRRRKRSEATC